MASLKLIAEIPTVWDESLPLDVGEYPVMDRRKMKAGTLVQYYTIPLAFFLFSCYPRQ
jgi:hypothetical protein